jgi:hypothetical protein
MISANEKGSGMSKSRHTEAQMIGALKQLEAGRKVEDVAREVGVSILRPSRSLSLNLTERFDRWESFRIEKSRFASW